MNLVFIGSGNALMAADFREELKLEVPVWVDPKRVTYQHLGFKRQFSLLFDPRVWLHGVRSARAGFRQKATKGDPWQQGGVMVVKKGGELVYGFASATAGDHPDLETVMRHARAAASAG